MAAKKQIRKPKLSKQLTLSPDGLQEVWESGEVQNAWDSLNDKYQEFFLYYIGPGNRNARKSFHATIDKTATDDVARSGGCVRLTNPNVSTILEALRKGRKARVKDLIESTLEEAVEQAFKPAFTKITSKDKEGNIQESTEMIEIPDYPTRIKAVEAMAKYEGFMNQDNQGPKGNVTNIQINLPGKTE